VRAFEGLAKGIKVRAIEGFADKIKGASH